VSAGGTLVLLYHRVAHLERDPHGLAVRPDRFAQHCEILRRRTVVPLGEINRSRREVAITFDDGYADNARTARGLLMRAGLPATFFITVGLLGQRGEAWWDRLEHTLLGWETPASTMELEIEGRPFWADIRSSAARARAHLALFWRLRPLRSAVIESVLAQVQTQLGVHEVNRETHRWMTIEELQELSTSDGVEIGAHTINHPFLTALAPAEQWEEIDGGCASIERLTGARARLFSYPYGGPDAFDSGTTKLVRDAGYTMACTATGGLARAECDSLQIPRNVVGDWDAERFERWLDHWLGDPSI
jgi:peptidoglycan/xylan/chitin deacetylase (PgdA/CDA1 family)